MPYAAGRRDVSWALYFEIKMFHFFSFFFLFAEQQARGERVQRAATGKQIGWLKLLSQTDGEKREPGESEENRTSRPGNQRKKKGGAA